MNKIIAAVALLAVFGAYGLRAEQKPKTKWDSIREYFQFLKQGLTESSVQGVYQKRGAVAVAAVRGKDQTDEKADLSKPQMKSPAKERKIKVRKAESREFEKAAELALAGKFEETIAALEAFEQAHPRSPLLDDVRAAKAKAKEAMEAQKAEAAKPEEPAKAGQ